MKTPVLPNTSVIPYCVATRQSSRGRDMSRVFRGVVIEFDNFGQEDERRTGRRTYFPSPIAESNGRRPMGRLPRGVYSGGCSAGDEAESAEIAYPAALLEKIRAILKELGGDEREIIESAHLMAEATVQALALEPESMTYHRVGDDSIYQALKFAAEVCEQFRELDLDCFEEIKDGIWAILGRIEQAEEAEELASLLDRLAQLQALSRLLRHAASLHRPDLAHACIPPPLDTSQVEAPGGKNALHSFLN